MTYYIKVRPYVAHRLGVEAVRYRYPDGDYLIWDKELAKVDAAWAFRPLEETVARIGGVIMDPYRNREEQQKAAEDCTPCPEPTDPAWATPEDFGNEEDSEGGADGTDGGAEAPSHSQIDNDGGSDGGTDGTGRLETALPSSDGTAAQEDAADEEGGEG